MKNWFSKKYNNISMLEYYKNNQDDFCYDFARWIFSELISEKDLDIPDYYDFCDVYHKNCKEIFKDFFILDEDGYLTDVFMEEAKKEIGVGLWCGYNEYIERFWLLMGEFMFLYYNDIQFFSKLKKLNDCEFSDKVIVKTQFRYNEYLGNANAG